MLNEEAMNWKFRKESGMVYFGEMFHHLPGDIAIWGEKDKFIYNSVLCIVISVNLTITSTAPAKF